MLFFKTFTCSSGYTVAVNLENATNLNAKPCQHYSQTLEKKKKFTTYFDASKKKRKKEINLFNYFIFTFNHVIKKINKVTAIICAL